MHIRKTLVLAIIFSKCKNHDEKLFREQESFEILQIICLLKNM